MISPVFLHDFLVLHLPTSNNNQTIFFKIIHDLIKKNLKKEVVYRCCSISSNSFVRVS